MTVEQDPSLSREIGAIICKVHGGDGGVGLDDAIASLASVIALFLSVYPTARSPEGLAAMVDGIAEGIRETATSYIVDSAFDVPKKTS